jgi:hypothetical protein
MIAHLTTDYTNTKLNAKGPDTNGWLKANTAARNPNDSALWLCVRVPTAVRDVFLAAVVGDLLSPDFPQNLVRREREMQARILEGAREVQLVVGKWRGRKDERWKGWQAEYLLYCGVAAMSACLHS